MDIIIYKVTEMKIVNSICSKIAYLSIEFKFFSCYFHKNINTYRRLNAGRKGSNYCHLFIYNTQ